MFWEKYISLCEENNISPNGAAKVIGVSNATCTKWKNGATPTGEVLLLVANYFDCSVDYLLGRTCDSRSHKNNIENVKTSSNSENVFFQKYTTLDEYGKRAVNALLEAEYARCSEMVNKDNMEYVYRAARLADNAEETSGGITSISKEKLDILETAPESDIK